MIPVATFVFLLHLEARRAGIWPNQAPKNTGVFLLHFEDPGSGTRNRGVFFARVFFASIWVVNPPVATNFDIFLGQLAPPKRDFTPHALQGSARR